MFLNMLLILHYTIEYLEIRNFNKRPRLLGPTLLAWLDRCLRGKKSIEIKINNPVKHVNLPTVV